MEVSETIDLRIHMGFVDVEDIVCCSEVIGPSRDLRLCCSEVHKGQTCSFLDCVGHVARRLSIYCVTDRMKPEGDHDFPLAFLGRPFLA